VSHDYTSPGGEFAVMENPDGSITVMTVKGVETVPGVTIRDHPLKVRGAVIGVIMRKIVADHEEHRP
jgi:hypothetical protein